MDERACVMEDWPARAHSLEGVVGVKIAVKGHNERSKELCIGGYASLRITARAHNLKDIVNAEMAVNLGRIQSLRL